jgi:hypothetical protein
MSEALTAAEQQFWINTALAAGVARSEIDRFIAENGVQDLPRILSAFAPNPGPGPGTGSSSYSAAIQETDPYAPASALGGPVGALTQPGPYDGSIVGSGAGSGGGPAAPLVLASSGPGVTILPAGGIPTWAIVIAVAALIFLFYDRK